MNLDEYLSDVNNRQKRFMSNLAYPAVMKDGFEVSVQASNFHYCSPRQDLPASEYYAFELGFPSQPDELIQPFAEDRETHETVYGYVPREIVEKLIKKHGGISHPSKPRSTRDEVSKMFDEMIWGGPS